MFLLYSLLAIEGADMAILPTSFKALEQDLGLTPSLLAATFTFQKLMEAIARPLWGCVVDSGKISRTSVLGLCCTGWGVTTILLGATRLLPTMLALRLITGLFLSAIHPLVQSILADNIAPERRGRAFGWAALIEMLGGLATGFLCTRLSLEMIAGISGWRWLYACIGIFSCAWGLLVLAVMPEPARPDGFMPASMAMNASSIVQNSFARLYYYVRETASFRVITLQGCFGSVPFGALAFQSMWLQSLGTFDNATAAYVGTIGALGHIPGHLLAGYIGDWLEHWKGLPARGYAGVVSLGSGAIYSYILFNMVSTSNPAQIAFVIFLMNACLWCQPAVNRPVLIRTVHPEHRASVMGWSLGLEGLSYSMFGAPMVGFLVDNVFGYSPETPGPDNAAALAKAMTIMCGLPWLAAAFIYSFLPGCIEADMLRCKDNKEWQPLCSDKL
jgi:MFS family permease